MAFQESTAYVPCLIVGVNTEKVLGKTALEDAGEWQYPTNALHRFFKISVEMP